MSELLQMIYEPQEGEEQWLRNSAERYNLEPYAGEPDHKFLYRIARALLYFDQSPHFELPAGLVLRAYMSVQ